MDASPLSRPNEAVGGESHLLGVIHKSTVNGVPYLERNFAVDPVGNLEATLGLPLPAVRRKGCRTYIRRRQLGLGTACALM